MTSRKILEIPKLIDLALGTPDIRVVNFSLLHALLHVMVKEIFDLEQMQIELIQKIDGKFEAILHRNSIPTQDITTNVTNVIFNVDNAEMIDEKLLLKECEAKSNIHLNAIDNLRKINLNFQSLDHASNDTLLVWDKNVSKTKKNKKLRNKKPSSDTEAVITKGILNATLNLADCPFQESRTPSEESGESQNISQKNSEDQLKSRLGEVDALERQYAGSDIDYNFSNNDCNEGSSKTKNNQKDEKTSPKSKKSNNDTIERQRAGEDKDTESSPGKGSQKAGQQEEETSSNSTKKRQKAGQDESTSTKRQKAGKTSDSDLEEITSSEAHLLKAVDSMQILAKQLETRMNVVEDTVKSVRKTLQDFNFEMTKNLENFNIMMENIKNASGSDIDTTAGMPLKTTELTAILKDVKHLKHDACDFKKQMKAVLNHIMTNIKIHKELEKKIIYPTEQSRHEHEYFDAKFMEMQEKFKETNKQIKVLEKQICNLNNEIEDLLVTKKEVTTSSLNLMDLHAELNEVKKYSGNVMRELEKVQQERQAYKQLMDAIKKDVETLFASKLDKEEIDELLTEKADCALLEQKLSIDDYNISRKRLENYVKNAIDRVSDLENNLKGKIQSFGDILHDKLDANELRLFRDEIDKKLHMLSDRISGMKGGGGGVVETGGASEAAATKSKLMSNVECLSCQKNVVMKMQQNDRVSLLSNCYVTKSIKPHLTYQLDLMRHDGKDLPFSRNLHHFESMMKKIKVTGKQKRYCGGSHTMVTNEDKIAAGSNKHGVREGAKAVANMKCIE